MDSYVFRQVFLPYCLQKLRDGRYIVLNRRYKPLGISSSAWVVYEEHPSAMDFKGLTAARIKKLSHNGDGDVGSIFLYNDGCIPTDGDQHWAAYSERLKLLADLQVSAQ